MQSIHNAVQLGLKVCGKPRVELAEAGTSTADSIPNSQGMKEGGGQVEDFIIFLDHLKQRVRTTDASSYCYSISLHELITPKAVLVLADFAPCFLFYAC